MADHSQTWGSGTYGQGHEKIIIGGAPDWKKFTEVCLTTEAIQPGEFVTTADVTNTTAEDIFNLGVAGDGQAGMYYLCLRRVGAKYQDIDTEIAAAQYIEVLRPSGGRFKVAVCRVDTDAAILEGQRMTMSTGGTLTPWAYTKDAGNTDSFRDVVGYAAADDADPNSGTSIFEMWY